MTAPAVRLMTTTDIERVSEIRVRGWQFAYRGLMPQSYLDALDPAKDAARRRARFSPTATDGVVNLVAEQDGETVRISSGIAEGERVALNLGDTVPEGQRIRPADAGAPSAKPAH